MESNFGRKLKHARELIGMKQADLAKASGVSLTYIGSLERGRRSQPGKDVLNSLAKVLKIDPIYFLDDSIETPFAVLEATHTDMPKEVKDFLLSEDSVPWIKLAQDCTLNDVTAEDARAIIEGLMEIKRREKQLQQNK